MDLKDQIIHEYLIINILIGFGSRADRFSNTGTAASRDRYGQV
jgi:hypothetical protein